MLRTNTSLKQSLNSSDDVDSKKPQAKKPKAESVHSMETRRQSMEKKRVTKERCKKVSISSKAANDKSKNEKKPLIKVVKLDYKYDPILNIWYGGKHPTEIDLSQIKEYPPHQNIITLLSDTEASDRLSSQKERSARPPLETKMNQSESNYGDYDTGTFQFFRLGRGYNPNKLNTEPQVGLTFPPTHINSNFQPAGSKVNIKNYL